MVSAGSRKEKDEEAILGIRTGGSHGRPGRHRPLSRNRDFAVQNRWLLVVIAGSMEEEDEETDPKKLA